MTTLEERLMEADLQREGRGKVWKTLRDLVSELEKMQVPYAVVGGIALQHYGSERSTRDLDLVLRSTKDLDAIHARLTGRGYTRKSLTSRHLRDDVTRVRVEFLIAGEYPGDGQPKPVRFPDPSIVAERSTDGICFVRVKELVEMKLASAKSAAHRIKDRADVLELIHLLGLKADFAEQLDPYVQQEFRELAALPSPTARDDE